MERNIYPISKIIKDGGSYFVYLDKNQLIYKVKKINGNFSLWQLVDNNKQNIKDMSFYTASVVKSMSELSKYKIINECY